MSRVDRRKQVEPLASRGREVRPGPPRRQRRLFPTPQHHPPVQDRVRNNQHRYIVFFLDEYEVAVCLEFYF